MNTQQMLDKMIAQWEHISAKIEYLIQYNEELVAMKDEAIKIARDAVAIAESLADQNDRLKKEIHLMKLCGNDTGSHYDLDPRTDGWSPIQTRI